MNTQQSLLITLLVLIFSCSGNEQRALLTANAIAVCGTDGEFVTVDSLKLEVGLPIHFDSSEYLIFPVSSEMHRSMSRSYSDMSHSTKQGYLSGNSYDGNLDNLMFQHVDSTWFRPLSKKALLIERFTFLEEFKQLTGTEWLVLEVIDRDSNKDGKLGKEDVRSLYALNMQGHALLKLSPTNQNLLDWKVTKINQRLYFRTQEDADFNGEFNHEDRFHHYYIGLSSTEIQVNKLYPLGVGLLDVRPTNNSHPHRSYLPVQEKC